MCTCVCMCGNGIFYVQNANQSKGSNAVNIIISNVTKLIVTNCTKMKFAIEIVQPYIAL